MPGPHGFAVRAPVYAKGFAGFCASRSFNEDGNNIARLAHLDRSRGSSRPAIPSVRHAAASTASRPNVRDDGQRPSSGQDGGTSSFDLPDGRSELFLQRELDRILLICPSANPYDPLQQIRV